MIQAKDLQNYYCIGWEHLRCRPSMTSSFSWPILAFACTEIGFVIIFALLALRTPKQATRSRVGGLLILATATYAMESLITPLCLKNGRPHWAAVLTAVLWVQLLNASDLLLLLGFDASRQTDPESIIGIDSAAGLLFNSRRVGTLWQIKNIPSTTGIGAKHPSSFVLRRIAVVAVSYLLLDIMTSFPPPDPVMVRSDKVALFLSDWSLDDAIFRLGATVSYWFTTAVVVITANNFCAILAVMTGLGQPADCPPAFGSFWEAYSVRRFWGYVFHALKYSVAICLYSLLTSFSIVASVGIRCLGRP